MTGSTAASYLCQLTTYGVVWYVHVTLFKNDFSCVQVCAHVSSGANYSNQRRNMPASLSQTSQMGVPRFFHDPLRAPCVDMRGELCMEGKAEIPRHVHKLKNVDNRQPLFVNAMFHLQSVFRE